ncbi:RM50 protein, partial [Neodrepanis coruscans]|nr:RM50 protein [Neodrepanis coruscans]
EAEEQKAAGAAAQAIPEDQQQQQEERGQPVPLCPPPRSRSYRPPQDLQSRLESHVREVLGPSLTGDWRQAALGDKRLKHRLLGRLAVELGHAVPNSRLHLMRQAGDLLEFYSAPVKDETKFDELAAAELPPNLRIVWKQ